MPERPRIDASDSGNRIGAREVSLSMYILQHGRLITAHRRPHAPAFEERVADSFLDLHRVEADEPTPKLHGWRLAHVDARGDWRLAGSNRLVASAPAIDTSATL